MDKLTNKQELLNKLNALTNVPDDSNIFIKEKIKTALLKCPELLYALNNKEYESEIFNEDGTINYDGDWSVYFGDASNIRPFLFLPDTQTDNKNYVCYETEFSEIPKNNKSMIYMQAKFLVMCDSKDSVDKLTGIARHDLISSILRERFNWSNIFGPQCKIVSNKGSFTDTNYIIRTIIFEQTIPNEITGTRNGKHIVINKQPWTT